MKRDFQKRTLTVKLVADNAHINNTTVNTFNRHKIKITYQLPTIVLKCPELFITF